MRFYNGIGISAYNPLQVNGFFLVLSLLIVFGIDSQRKTFLKPIGALVAASALFFTVASYQRSLILHSVSYLQIKEIEKSALAMKPKWDVFKNRVGQIVLIGPEDPNDINNLQFKEREQSLQAMEILGQYPIASYTQAEMEQFFSNFQTQPDIRPMFATFMGMPRFPIIAYYNLLNRLIPSVRKSSNLTPNERQKMAQQIWDSISKQARDSVMLTEALVSMALIRKMLDNHLIEGVPLEKIDSLQSRMKVIRTKIDRVSRPWDSISAPTDQRLKKIAQDLYVREVLPTLQAVDEMMTLIAGARVVKIR